MENRSQKTFTLCIIIGLFWLLGFNKYYPLAPDSFHQGAQTDRASIVLNYANGSADFMYPKIMETRVSDGIVGCEFPGLYYLLGKTFSFTGFRYDIYRLSIWLFYLVGLWSIFTISRNYLNYLTSVLITLTLACSPILCFYGLNFLSDVPAMGLSLLGWMFLLSKKRSKTSLIIGFLVLGLAGLLKASYTMHIATAFSIFIIENKKIKWEVLVSGLIGLAAIAGWYEWATYINEKFQNPHFLLKPNPARDFPDFVALIKSNWANWAREMYPLLTLILAALGIFTQFKNRKEEKILFKISTRLTLFWIAFYLLFQTQFKYHDYYFIAVIPLLFFLVLHFALYIKRISISLILLYTLLLFTCIQNFSHAKNQLYERHKPGSYFYQPPMPGLIEKYVGIDSFLDENIPQEAKIISVFDNNPNNTLFFARHKGCRIAKDFSDDLIKEILQDPRFEYVLVNDTTELNTRLAVIGIKPMIFIAEHNEITLFKK